MMKFMFILAAVCIPIFVYFDKGATGILFSLFLIIVAGIFSKPSYHKKNE